ncbi:MAG: sugar ABC transporter ATP-binding protein [Actinomycetes bacterium]
MQPQVVMKGISKRFDAVHALTGVDLTLYPGEVHTIAGENGSGKSTLLKILAGVLKPDAGAIEIAGSPVEYADIRAAMSHGVTMVSQELSLVPHLGVAENVFLGHNQTRSTFGIDWKDTDKRSLEVLKRLNLAVNPRAEVSSLPQHQQQLVEIARALASQTRVLLLDEPTSSLAPAEVEALFNVVRQLRDDGVSIVMISHRMSEMLTISDRFTVLRDSKFIDSSTRNGVDENWLIDRMVLNKPTVATKKVKSNEPLKTIMEVKDLSDFAGAFEAISFKIHEGEIVGLAGLAGAGRTELVEAIVGAHPRRSGDVLINGKKIGHNTRSTMNSGIALVPDDRRLKSTIHEMSVRDNLLLAVHGRPAKNRSRKKEEKIVNSWIEKFSIKVKNLDAPISSLSGGNQQKVVIARCLVSNPKVLILDEATRGIDLGAKAEIYEILRGLAREGLAILVVSSEITEIFEISDRVLVMHAGGLTADLDRSTIKESDVVSAATGVLV